MDVVKKSHLMLCLALTLPAVAQINVAQAAVNVDVNTPSGSIHIGDQDTRGHYWDGYEWRSPQWWHQHHNKRLGERNSRGLYWHGDRWDPKPPPKHFAGAERGMRPDQGNGTHGAEGHGPIPPTSGPHS